MSAMSVSGESVNRDLMTYKVPTFCCMPAHHVLTLLQLFLQSLCLVNSMRSQDCEQDASCLLDANRSTP